MRRTALLLVIAGLVLAPAAVAKGPHVVLTSGPEAVLPGVPWEATVELNEFRSPPTPLLIAIGRNDHVDAKVRKAETSIDGAVAFKTTMVFPSAGRWKLMLVAGKRRFNFPALEVGSGAEPKDYVAFPVGSYAARQGGGGVLITGEQRAGAGESLASEGVTLADPESGGDGGGIALWLFPILGVVLVGVGAAAVTRRGSR